MATIVTVHGTFAHTAVPSGTAGLVANGPPAWWQTGSDFDKDCQALLESEGGSPRFLPFIWSGDNSEADRREAGRRLLGVLLDLEKQNEPYCLVAHSHGGSVVSAALLRAAAKRQMLPGLKRWITVGTPFVTLRKERFLFTRLSFINRAIYVATLMLLFMLLFGLGAQIVYGDFSSFADRRLMRLGISGALMMLPFLLCYIFWRIAERRDLHVHSPRVKARAKEYFGGRWLSLTHEDDEAVQGLTALKSMQFSIFDREFAVGGLAMLSVFVLPLTYLALVFSPGLMNRVADYLVKNVYVVPNYEARAARFNAIRLESSQMWRSMAEARRQLATPGLPQAEQERLRKALATQRLQTRARWQKMYAEFPDYLTFVRAERFRRQFMSRDGKSCGSLCDGGTNKALNSDLIMHLITDRVVSVFGDDNVRWSAFGGVLRFLAPVLLIPILFGITAVLVCLFVQFIGRFVSGWLASALDSLTWSEIKRASLGNDTESEVALGAAPRPPWLDTTQAFLPAEIGDQLSNHSNAMASQSLAKFRNAISELAFADRRKAYPDLVSNYLSWRELIHTAYFDTASFRKLVAHAIAESEGFRPRPDFSRDSEFAKAATWLFAVSPPAGTLTPQPPVTTGGGAVRQA
ncbi:MAG: hypothetical protein KDJ41_16695 [Hyphomicrobiaceae bacterium]|nr:hypothetical protein [Hyphomicrobiaceae bacterium]